MLKREGFPVCAKQTSITIGWVSTDADNVNLESAFLTFDNVNVTTAGYVAKERTTLPFDPANPTAWVEDVPQEVIDFLGSPEDGIRLLLGMLYEGDEHQYRLGTKVRPDSTP